MYFLRYEAHPSPSHAEYGVVDGAFVALWVNQPLETAAKRAAEDFITGQGWDVSGFEEAYPVTRDSYKPGEEGRDRVAQATIDGIVAVFHRWPVGAPDE